MNADITTELAKALPPVVVTGAITVGGLELEVWVKGLTIFYIVMQMAFLVFKAVLLRGRQDRDE